jgi:hypothetical protein
MKTKQQIPIALSIVSYLFLFMGIVAVVEIIIAATRGSIHANFYFLGIWIFAGLRRFSRGWRTCALVFTWLGLIGLTFIIGCVLYDGGAVYLRPSDHKMVSIPLVWSLAITLPFFLLQLWQYRVLTRVDIRDLFFQEKPN